MIYFYLVKLKKLFPVQGISSPFIHDFGSRFVHDSRSWFIDGFGSHFTVHGSFTVSVHGSFTIHDSGSTVHSWFRFKGFIHDSGPVQKNFEPSPDCEVSRFRTRSDLKLPVRFGPIFS